MLLDEKALEIIRANRPLQRFEESLIKAAVAIVLRDTAQGTEFLMMQRAKHEDDPWSGQMSFPGGKIDAGDASAKATAVREAYEEVGVELNESNYLGQLDDLYGIKVNGVLNVHVACFVFKLNDDVKLRANYEVADMVWLPMSYLDDRANAHDYFHPSDDKIKMPAILIDQHKEQILWGLSLRMLIALYELLGLPMSVLDDHDRTLLNNIDKQSRAGKKMRDIIQKKLDKQEAQ